MRSEPRWLTPDKVVHLNELVVAATGEPFGLRDRGLLESACAKPEHRWHYEQQDDVADLASTLLFGIAQNHPFIQGNKRTAFEAALAFLKINGWTLESAIDPALGDMVVAALVDETLRGPFAASLGNLLIPRGR